MTSRLLLILLVACLPFAGGCGASKSKPDAEPTEESTAPSGVRPDVLLATAWMPEDTQILAGGSTSIVWDIFRESFPPRDRAANYDAFIDDVGRIFQARLGVDVTRVESVAVGYGSSGGVLVAYGDLSIEDASAGSKTVSGTVLHRITLDPKTEAWAIPFAEPKSGIAFFVSEEDALAALDARGAAQGVESLARLDGAPVVELFEELPASNAMFAATIEGALREQMTAEVGGFVPERVGLSLGASSTLMVRGDRETIQRLESVVEMAIREFRAPIQQQYDARGGLPATEAAGVVTTYHYTRAYLDALEIERTDTSLLYRIELPSSQFGAALPGIGAAIAIPAFLRYIRRSKAAEADHLTQRMANSAVAGYSRSAAENPATATFPGGTDVSIVSVGEIPTDGTKLPAQPMSQGGGVGSAELFATLGMSFEEDGYYFQYTYETGPGTGRDATAVVTARADFDVGGPQHTLRYVLQVDADTGELRLLGPTIENELE